MAVSQGLPSVSLDLILNSVREIDILSHYLGISKVPCVINSPLRIDKNPSFGIWWGDNDKIFFTDFATKDRGDIYTLFERKWGLSYSEVLQRIFQDLPKIASTIDRKPIISSRNSKNRKVYTQDTNLQCKVRMWKSYDLEYWETYGISKEWLIFGEVYPISHIIITKKGNQYIIPADKFAYAYVERKDGKVSLKLYQPFSIKHKWSNKHDSSVWDLWEKLPQSGEFLIITSSRKDALCVWENTNIPAVSLQAESYLPKKHVMEELKDRFKYIFVLYDNDFSGKKNWGRIAGNTMAKEFNLRQIEIPDEYKSKDPSDLCKNYGRQTVKLVIPQLIEDSINLI